MTHHHNDVNIKVYEGHLGSAQSHAGKQNAPPPLHHISYTGTEQLLSFLPGLVTRHPIRGLHNDCAQPGTLSVLAGLMWGLCSSWPEARRAGVCSCRTCMQPGCLDSDVPALPCLGL